MIDLSLGPFVLNAPPHDGVLNGLAAHGAFLVDRSTGDLYRNTGTISATVWAKLGDVQMGSGANVGDVPTWDGNKYVPQAPSGGGGGETLTLTAQGTEPAPPASEESLFWRDADGYLHQLDDTGSNNFRAQGGDGTGLGGYVVLQALLTMLGVGPETKVRVQEGQIQLDAQDSDGNPGTLLIYGLPTSDRAVDGAVWNDTGTLKISAG